MRPRTRDRQPPQLHDRQHRTRCARSLRDHPDLDRGPSGGNAVVASHSYGGAVAEYLAFELATIEERLGPLADGATIPFTIAAGVPALVVGYQFAGPSLRALVTTTELSYRGVPGACPLPPP